MKNNKLIVSHAPFWHDGDSLFKMNLNIMIAAVPAVIAGIMQFGVSAAGVLALAVSTAMAWELIMNVMTKQPIAIGNLDSAVIGLMLGMLMPAVTPWWIVVIGTLVAVGLGKMVFGGVGANPFNPALIGMAILMLSWKAFLDFDTALVNFDFSFVELAPLAAVKANIAAASDFSLTDLLIGREIGGIGSTSGLAIIIGGIYLMLRGYTRWEISISFVLGILITAGLFHLSNPDSYAGPLFHLFSGYTLLGAFFLATENSSSPVNRIPMLIYGFLGGFIIMLMRNIGVYPDGTVLAILLINLVNPLIDNIRPKALGKVENHA